MHGDTKRTEEKPARKINGRGGGGGEKWRRKEQSIIEPLTCTTKMTMPMVPSMCLLSSSHSSTFSKQPWKKKKKKRNKRGSEDASEEIHLVRVWQRNRVAIPGSRFLQDNAPPTYEIYTRMNELPGEQMNYPWAMPFICRLMGRMGRCVHTNS